MKDWATSGKYTARSRWREKGVNKVYDREAAMILQISLILPEKKDVLWPSEVYVPLNYDILNAHGFEIHSSHMLYFDYCVWRGSHFRLFYTNNMALKSLKFGSEYISCSRLSDTEICRNGVHTVQIERRLVSNFSRIASFYLISGNKTGQSILDINRVVCELIQSVDRIFFSYATWFSIKVMIEHRYWDLFRESWRFVEYPMTLLHNTQSTCIDTLYIF